MALSDLPLDLFQSILTHLSRGDLSRISTTSKQTRSAVEPTLYRRISWRWQKDVPKHPPLPLLVRTLLSRPDLALCIRDIECHGRKPRVTWETCPYTKNYMLPAGSLISVWCSEGKRNFSAIEMATLKKLIVSLHFASQDSWLEELERGEIDVFVGILLYQSLNLQCLVLESDFQRDSGFVGDVIRHGLESTAEQQFSCIQSVTYSDDITRNVEVAYHATDLNQILPLFYFQSIGTLRASLPSLNIAWPLAEISKSSLTSLTLTQSQLSEESLGSLLMATPRLRCFRYHSHLNIDSGGRQGRNHTEYFDCDKLEASLLQVKDTLETLVLSIRFSSLQSSVGLGGFRGMSGRVKALRGFKQLKSCEMPIIMLFGWEHDAQLAMADLVPPGLADLCLTDDLDDLGESEWTDESLLQPFEIYLGNQEQSEFKLRSMRLFIRAAQTSWCEEQREKLRALGNAKKINCVVSKSKPDILLRRSGTQARAYKSRGAGSSRGTARGRGT